MTNEKSLMKLVPDFYSQAMSEIGIDYFTISRVQAIVATKSINWINEQKGIKPALLEPGS